MKACKGSSSLAPLFLLCGAGWSAISQFTLEKFYRATKWNNTQSLWLLSSSTSSPTGFYQSLLAVHSVNVVKLTCRCSVQDVNIVKLACRSSVPNVNVVKLVCRSSVPNVNVVMLVCRCSVPNVNVVKLVCRSSLSPKAPLAPVGVSGRACEFLEWSKSVRYYYFLCLCLLTALLLF
jgi:hypothetical protein